ncbi:MAG: hypothetical protein AABZ12_09830 [Planctomycetota bacterium]
MAHNPNNSSKDDGASRADPSETTPPNPRAFVVGSGLVYQGVGVALILAACAVWAVTAPAGPMPSATSDSSAEPALTRTTLAMFATFVGGLALAAVGVGLQGERRESGKVALAFSGTLAAVYAALLVAPLFHQAWLACVVLAIPLTAMIVLFALARESAKTLRRHPPPPDQSIATPEFLEAHRKEREERRKSFDL